MATVMESLSQECLRQINRLDCSMHNIANVGTPGFKAAMLFFNSALDQTETGEMGETEPLIAVDYSPGVLRKTGNTLDLAIQGEGFFTIETQDGNAYTRDGRFTLNSSGELVTQSGDYVLGQTGRITISGGTIEVSEDGTVKSDDVEADQLHIVCFERSDKLIRGERGLFFDKDEAANPSVDGNSTVQSGFLEMSNVQAIQEMVKLIDIHRSFESYQKMMQTIQEQDKLSTSDIGRLA